MWMHSVAAFNKYGSVVAITAAINRGEVHLDDGLPLEGEFASPSDRLAARLALTPDIPLDKLSHAMHNSPKPREVVDGIKTR